MATQEELQQFRDIVSSRPEDERNSFIAGFSQLDEGKREMAIQKTLQMSPAESPQPSQQEQVQEQGTTFSRMPNNQLGARMLNPAVPVARGIAEGATSFYSKADAITKMLEKVGIPRGGLFEEFAKSSSNFEQSLPEFVGDPQIETALEMAGSIVPTLTEFALLKLPASFGSLTTVGKFSVLESLDEISKGGGVPEATEGAMRGAAVGMSFPIAGKAWKVLQRSGKGAARWFVQIITNNKALAEDFIKNPKKYNVNPLGKTKTVREIKSENESLRIAADDSRKIAKQSFREKQVAKREQMTRQMTDAKTSQRAHLQEQKEQLVKGKGESIERASQKAEKVIASSNQALKDNVVHVYDSSLTSYNRIRKESGDAVGDAVKTTLNRNPAAGIPSKEVNKTVSEITKDFSPFTFKNGKAVPRTKIGADEKDIKLFEDFMGEFNSHVKSGNIPVGYLQQVKKDLHNISSKYYKAGNNSLGKMYSEYSKALNPAKLASKVTGPAKADLADLAQANKNFSEMVPKYEEAMRLYFKEVNGKWHPNPDPMLKAISGGDPVLLRRAKMADSVLPKADRILPKAEELVKNAATLEAQQNGIVKALKRQVKEEHSLFMKTASKAKNDLAKSQRFASSEVKRKANKEFFEFTRLRDEEYRAVMSGLTKQELFLQDQAQLRAFMGSGLTGRLQNAGLFGAVTSGVGSAAGLSTGGLLGPSLVLSGGLSPAVTSPIIKSLLASGQAADALVTPILASEALQKILGKRALENKEKNQPQGQQQ